MVPPQVVQRGIDQHYVYRVNGDKVESVPVKVLYQDSELNIISGIGAGDVLVSDGQSRLKPGSQVQVSADTTVPEQVAGSQVQP
ncbi:Multidrug resistance protein MdtA precursor [compost metagenome]